jgi:hypothetical protein
MVASGRMHLFASHRRFAALVLAGACVAFATTLHATSVAKLTDQQLVRFSSAVAEGHVTGVHSDWNSAHTQIYTTVAIRVTNQIKGTRPQSGVLTVKLLGGRVGDVMMELIDQPTFKVDEDVIVCLDAASPQYTPITGLFQGKLTVAADPVTGALNVIDRGVSRDTFVRDISRIVTEQGGR